MFSGFDQLVESLKLVLSPAVFCKVKFACVLLTEVCFPETKKDGLVNKCSVTKHCFCIQWSCMISAKFDHLRVFPRPFRHGRQGVNRGDIDIMGG